LIAARGRHFVSSPTRLLPGDESRAELDLGTICSLVVPFLVNAIGRSKGQGSKHGRKAPAG
jgi:hypothetical protein